MPRKLSLSTTQNAVLRLLEEAGEEDMRTVRGSVQIGRQELSREIAVLERIGLVQESNADEHPTLLLTADGKAAMAS